MTRAETHPHAAAPATVLQASKLQVDHAGHRAVALDSLMVGRGELVGVVGANGAGKSTLVNAIAGFSRGRPRVAGEIRLDGQSVGHWPAHRRVRAGLLLVPEGRLVFDSMSVQDNLSVAFHPDGGSAQAPRRAYSREEVYELFPRLKERRDHLGRELSGGERQMLGIGRALMMGPRVLMLDEPSIGLAPMLVEQVLVTMRRLADEGLSILLVEQNVRAALQVVDRLMLLERGRLMKEGDARTMAGDASIAQAYLGGHR
jgi:branched-chain amino acid transport system ATP-binding protein